MSWNSSTPTSLAKPARTMVIGIYGVPGSGKSYHLNQLKLELEQDHFKFYEGSEVIGSVTPGGLTAFQTLEDHDKDRFRRQAIDTIKHECTASGYVGVVTGHFMFWPEGKAVGQPVHTDHDFKTFTHVVYLNIPADLIVRRRRADKGRSRPQISEQHLSKWQLTEKTELRDLCRQNNILFYVLSPQHHAGTLPGLLRHFRQDTNTHNLMLSRIRLDEAVLKAGQQAKTILVLDGDKTLAAEDTGTIFWKEVAGRHSTHSQSAVCPLQALFGGPLGYSDTAFRQAALLYDEIADKEQFNAICEAVAASVTMHPEFITLLRSVTKHVHVVAVVVTCGLRLIWEKVLKKVGLINSVAVIGGGRIEDGFVVTPTVKADLVIRMRDVHHLHVWAFGDSLLDLAMMKEAHQSIVVVGEEHTRSKSMDMALLQAMEKQGLQARQVLLPEHAPPRLSTVKLPVTRFTDQEFVDSILRPRTHQFLDLVHPESAKLLATRMRDAKVAGPALRDVHHRVGWYLAMTFLPSVLGIEQSSIQHVQGHLADGHQLQHERKTAIVALMRGGEAMAFGVNDAFPLAMFVHARAPDDVRPHHVQDCRAIVLVDSVVNSGKSLRKFVEHIRRLHATIQIVVVVGVVQAESTLPHDANLVMVALRRSNNKFTGKGTTDTGNRLFNTTHLE